MKLFISVLVFTFSFAAFVAGQNGESVRYLDSTYNSNQTDSLEVLYAVNKIIPGEYKTPILLALSYFPELDSTTVVFKENKIRTTLNTRPTMLSLIFRKREKRKYVIRINNSQKKEKILLNELPFNASVGILGHEYSHIIDYNNRGFFGVLKRAFSYLSKKSKSKFEKKIDTNTINRGLGWQLYDLSDYILNKSDATEKYKKFKKRTYLTPKDIKVIIDNQ
ncbi:MAG: hypothetical protein B6D61_03610 [Bacteroidetes bacterium 4484_249]|nr:MAG: hypothetical protein B6D61_03610 [Bacteroidetes bacterium 4484_249]